MFKELDKYRVLYEEKQQELLKYFVSQQIKLKQKITEMQQLKQGMGADTPKPSDFRGYRDDPGKSNNPEVKFLILMKEKLKILKQALDKERSDKLKLARRLRETKTGPETTRHDHSPMFTRESVKPRLSFRKTTSLHNPFNFSSEEKSHRNTMIGKPCIDEPLFTTPDDLNSSMRKSFDETNSRLEEKYGEKFWQNQVQRVIKQSQNYSMLYNTNKKIRDKEKLDLKNENEKLHKRNKEVEESMKKLQEELEMYKKEISLLDPSKGSKKKIVMKPKRRLQPPTQVEEDSKTPNKPLNKVNDDKSMIKTHSKEIESTKTQVEQPLPSSGIMKPAVSVGSDKSSNPGNVPTVSIQPKTNTINAVKGPLKNYSKRSESKKGEKVTISVANSASESLSPMSNKPSDTSDR